MDDLVIIHKKIKDPQVMAPPAVKQHYQIFLITLCERKNKNRYGVVKSSGYSKAAST